MYYSIEDIIKLGNKINAAIIKQIELKVVKVSYLSEEEFLKSKKISNKNIKRIIVKFEDIYACAKNGEINLIYYLDNIFENYNYLVSLFEEKIFPTIDDLDFWKSKSEIKFIDLI